MFVRLDRFKGLTFSGLLLLGTLLLPGQVGAEEPQENHATARLQVDGEPPAVERVSVLVHLDPSLQRSAVEREDVRAFAANQGGLVKYEYKVVLPNVLNLRDIPVSAMAGLENLPGVIRVEEDRFHENVIKLAESTTLIRGMQSQIAAAGLAADGSGVRVCVCDTGIDTNHIMYADRIDFDASYDFHNDDPDPEDDNGHGAHVAGIAVGRTGLSTSFCNSSQPFQGVAPEATLIGVKILNKRGGGYTSRIIAGIDHCADQSPTGGRADVINLSIGTGQFTGADCDGQHSWADAANDAVDAGVVVVAASGNECFTNALSSPACGSKVMAIGATYDYPNCHDTGTSVNWGCCSDSGIAIDDVVCFSNQSDSLDVAAPGSNIYSAYIGQPAQNDPGNGITAKSGTSMASPQVAGLAALIIGVDPSLTPAQVRQIIRDGAIDLGPAGFDRGYGHGRIDVINSLSLISGCITDGDCDDGLVCNGAETCDLVTGICQAGTPIDCDDGVSCTSDTCNEPSGSCSSTPDDTLCDDGLFCNGVETCDAGLDCLAGTEPCTLGEVCLEDSDTCCTSSTEVCNDGVDNDCDDLTDCDDSDCSADPDCDCQLGQPGDPCSSNADCCSDKCRGRPGGKTCKA